MIQVLKSTELEFTLFQQCKIQELRIGLQVKKDLKTLSLLLQEVYQDQELIIHLTKVMGIIYYPQIEILV